MRLKQVPICIMLLLTPVVLFASELKYQKESELSFNVRDGSSFEKAIIVKYIGDYQKSIYQEYQYLETKFGVRGKDWNLLLQSLKDSNGRAYDEMTIELSPSKETFTLYGTSATGNLKLDSSLAINSNTNKIQRRAESKIRYFTNQRILNERFIFFSCNRGRPG